MKPLGLGRMHQLRHFIFDLPRTYKQAAMIASDIVGISLCVWSAAWVATGSRQLATTDLVLLTAVSVVAAAPIAWHEGLYRSIIRYMGVDLFVAGSKTILAVSAISGILVKLGELLAAPFRWTIAFAALSLIYILGSRFLARIFLNRRNLDREPVIIYGAGEGGARLTAALMNGDDDVEDLLSRDAIPHRIEAHHRLVRGANRPFETPLPSSQIPDIW